MKEDPKYYFKKINEFHFPEIFKVEKVWDALKEKEKVFSKFKDSEIKGNLSKNVHFEGKVIVKEKTRILHNSIIEGPVYIGKNCVIGPNAHIRKGTIIGDNCKIGKSEIKNSIVLNNVRADHFGYVGDSILGENSHIGAGVVTANFRFDDKNIKKDFRKLGVILGDNSQIGVNATTFPGSCVGPDSWIYPDGVVRGFIPKDSILKWKPDLEVVEKR